MISQIRLQPIKCHFRVQDTEYAEIINQQQGEFLIAESTCVLLTNTYTARYFNNYVQNSVRSEIVK